MIMDKSCLYLIGMPGCGKTTLGEKYARFNGYTFADTDEIIIKDQKKTIEKIYTEVGEMGFRKLEQELLKRFSDKKEMVICTGGGLPCFLGNMEIMNNQGITVFMDVSNAEIWNRIKNTDFSGRPIYQNKTTEQIQVIIAEKSKERKSFYSKAHITLKSDDIVLEDLLTALDKLHKQ
jgi:shikimate kinase